jgi:VWFA-related protein
MRYANPLLMVFFCCCFSFPVCSQQSTPPPQVAPPESASALPRGGPGHRISLDVVVTDKSGNSVPGLQQKDFTLLDDKQPQTILSFHVTDFATSETSKPDDPPQQAILLVDAVNAGFQGVGQQRQQLERFLRQNNGQLLIPMSLVILSDTSTELQRVPTRDGNALADSLRSQQPGLRINGRSQGFYGARDRLQISLRALERLISVEATQPGRKLLVWLSPGWPLLSGPGVELTAKNQEFLFNTVVELSGALREARITLYSLDAAGVADAASFRTFYYKSFLKGVRSADKVQSGNLGLQVLATQTGGRVLSSSNDMATSIASCLVDAKAFYTISFDSPPADHPNEYHDLQVKIDKPGLTARTQTGYYAQK